MANNKPSIPEAFFKYIDIPGLSKSLQNRTFLWRCPLAFNDPLDVRRNISTGLDRNEIVTRITERMVRLTSDSSLPLSTDELDVQIIGPWRNRIAKGEPPENVYREIRYFAEKSHPPDEIPFQDFQEPWERWLEQIRLFCVSERRDSLLMWSHYADCHRGAVVELRMERHGVTCPHQFIKKVKYCDTPPHFLSNEEWLARLFGDKVMFSERDLFSEMLCTKYNDWSYEQEWRVATKANEWPGNQEFSFIPFDPSDIVAIYLGCRTQSENIEMISELLNHGFEHVRKYQFCEVPGKFQLEPKEIS